MGEPRYLNFSLHIAVQQCSYGGFSEECLKDNKGIWGTGTGKMKLRDKWTGIHWDYLLGYMALREEDSTTSLRECTRELAGDKTSKLNSHYFSLSESFLCGRAETYLHFSLVQCHVVLCT